MTHWINPLLREKTNLIFAIKNSKSTPTFIQVLYMYLFFNIQLAKKIKKNKYHRSRGN
jgi:hypothetical protein